MNLCISLYWAVFSFIVHLVSLVKGFPLVFSLKNMERSSGATRFSCPSLTNQEVQSASTFSVTSEELDRISHEIHIQKNEIASILADTVYYNNSLEPALYRINPDRDDEMWNQNYISLLEPKQNLDVTLMHKVEKVASLTYNWCSNFVQTLNLCPWAKLSIQSKNSIKIHILNQRMGLENMEHLVRKGALELMDLTERGKVDENSGITFVVAMHDEDVELGVQGPDFYFETFYNFCTGLEDRLLNEDDVDMNELYCTDMQYTPLSSIGDEVIIAPFHPEWRWNSFDTHETTQQNLDVQDEPLNFEKKSPFPTISMVRSRVVFDAGEETTRRIGIHNERILSEMGSKTLEEFYKQNVYTCKNSQGDAM